ncbi:hypothetical protein SNEBB_001089 [Seison nebaliae]|nr:hypothetical protein SNEBB_001089 [Seison nebaliae]
MSFIRLFSKFSRNCSTNVERVVMSNENDSFPTLLRKSQFVELGELKNQILIGKIVEVKKEDIYVDYGGKFLAICRKKKDVDSHLYKRNVSVIIKLLEWEMADKFLGAAKHISLLESDAYLIGLVREGKKGEK